MARTIIRHLYVVAVAIVLAACGSDSASDAGASSSAASVTLEWDPNTETDLAGYKIYSATMPGAYQAPIATVPANATMYVVNGLQSGTTNFFVVTAFNASSSESAFSNEVSKTVF